MDFPEPVIGIAVEPKTQKDLDKLSNGLAKLAEEDPTFTVKTDEQTGQTVISGMGELHLDIIIDRLKREFKVECNQGRPQVNYKEAITKTVELREVYKKQSGELHLDIIIDRLKREFKVECNQGRPQVNYKEAITKTVELREVYKKQSGGRGKFADIIVTVGPVDEDFKQGGLQFVDEVKGGNVPKEFIPSVQKGFQRGKFADIIVTVGPVDEDFKQGGLQFVDEVKGGNVPKEFIPSVQKGFQTAMKNGILAGFPLDSLKVVLKDGSFHPVDSDQLSFEICAIQAYKNACAKAAPVLMEPIMKLEVVTPEENMGRTLVLKQLRY